MYLSYLICVFVLYSAAVDGKAVVTDYEHNPQVNGWLKLHRSPTTWRNARLKCFDEGAVLASPENEALLDAMIDVMSTDTFRLSQVFTGIHDTFSKGLFYSLGGSPWTEIPSTWVSVKPDSGNTESCLSLVSDGILMENKCTDELPFMCYRNNSATNNSAPSLLSLSCGPTDNGYTYYGTTGSCYKFYPEGKYWRDAFAACDEEDAHLAIINSNVEAQTLKNLFSDNFYSYGREKNDVRDVVHIGFVDWGKKGGQWMTIHGQTLEEAGYAIWHAGEPNNKTNQFCGGLNVDGGLDDVNCSDGDPQKNTRSFICEKKPKSTEGYSINNAYLIDESSPSSVYGEESSTNNVYLIDDSSSSSDTESDYTYSEY